MSSHSTNTELAYLLGMIYGNGEVRRDNFNTTVSIDIPHKKLETEEYHDIQLYVRASIADIKDILQPLLGTNLTHSQEKRSTILSFTKPNGDFIIREINNYIANQVTHETMRIHSSFFNKSFEERKYLMMGISDVTGYTRRSNYAFQHKYDHRVYIEVPHNWYMVADICNLLYTMDIPVQNIDWAHPNFRDPQMVKYNEGKPNFWKKEHQIKIYANEFLPIGFGILHKQQSLETFVDEMRDGYNLSRRDISRTHLYYWERRVGAKPKAHHPGENDPSIPTPIRNVHYNSWQQLAEDLGYYENSI